MILKTLTGAVTMGSQGRDILQSPVTATYHPLRGSRPVPYFLLAQTLRSGTAHSTAPGYVLCTESTNNATCLTLSCVFSNVLGYIELHMYCMYPIVDSGFINNY